MKIDCPFCNPSNRCPYCNPPRAPYSECTLGKPLWMVIPPEGVHLDCPAHPEGHHIFGSPTWMSNPPSWKASASPFADSAMHGPTYDTSGNQIVEYDSTQPFGTCTGVKF
jgi:hypothetical protein